MHLFGVNSYGKNPHYQLHSGGWFASVEDSSDIHNWPIFSQFFSFLCSAVTVYSMKWCFFILLMPYPDCSPKVETISPCFMIICQYLVNNLTKQYWPQVKKTSNIFWLMSVFASTTVSNRWWQLRGFFICFIGLNKPPNIWCSMSAIGGWRGWALNLALSTYCSIKSGMLNMGTVHRSARWANTWHSMAWRWCQSLSRRMWNHTYFPCQP